MALFKILKSTVAGNKAKLTDITRSDYLGVNDGYCYYTPDDNKFYIDSEYLNTSNQVISQRACLNPGPGFYFGTCTTDKATVTKMVTVTDPTFVLKEGVTVAVYFVNQNGVASPTLNVNESGSYPLRRMGSTAMSTGTTTNGWQDKSLLFLTYVNTGTAAVPDWAWVEHYWNNTTYYYTTVYSTTAAGTAAKVGSTSAFTLTAGRHFMLMTTTGNSYAGKITLNVSSTGAKDVWINGAVSSSTNYNLPKGIYLVYYDGTNYHIRTDGKIPHADINFSISATAVDETNLITQYNGTDNVVLKLPQGLSGFARINSTEFVGSLLGNADTATKLKTPRTIALTGAVTGSGSFDGSGNLSIATTANHTHYYLTTIGDQRGTATTPNTYNNQFIFQGLKTNSSFGAPSTDTYSYVLGLRGWSDSSGGNAWELAFNNTGIFARTGATTAWNAWKQIPFGDGTGASGTWGINISGTATNATNVNIADDTSSRVYVLGATTTGNTRIYRESSVYMENNVLMGAAWNDYAEYRMAETKEPGRVVCETSFGKMILTTKRLQPACEIISDTFGFAIGQTEKCETPIAAAGRVLAYTFESRGEFELGDAVCSGPNGTVSRMTRAEIMQYPERIIGTVSEIPSYDTWGENNIKVNNRIWIRIR